MATLADIAKHAAVSTGTASRVLNNKMTMPISQATIDRIRQAALELDYQPNAVARALATGKTRTIGLHYPGTTETMFIRILEAVEARARERGYHLIVSSRRETFSAQSAIDGLINITSLDDPPGYPSGRKPIIHVSPVRPGQPDTCLITWSEFDAAFMAVEHLAKLGHTTIAALWGAYPDERDPATGKAVLPRVAGFRAGVARFGLAAAELFDETHPDPIHRGYLQMKRLRDEKPETTAVFVRNDYLAMGALKALHRARIEVPEQMSLIHYGDSVLSQAAYPELTSVSHPNAEASVLALEKLIEMSENNAAAFPAITLPITLCERASCAPPPKS